MINCLKDSEKFQENFGALAAITLIVLTRILDKNYKELEYKGLQRLRDAEDFLAKTQVDNLFTGLGRTEGAIKFSRSHEALKSYKKISDIESEFDETKKILLQFKRYVSEIIQKLEDKKLDEVDPQHIDELARFFQALCNVENNRQNSLSQSSVFDWKT